MTPIGQPPQNFGFVPNKNSGWQRPEGAVVAPIVLDYHRQVVSANNIDVWLEQSTTTLEQAGNIETGFMAWWRQHNAHDRSPNGKC
ncbi:hypothetical protein ACF8R6_11165 [Pseudomonas sp. CJQ_7]|uniref:hypothetical protein n=1 Tax=Pseudomonas sp. CJQ_7 TaxID=3367166 RepID=UPI00370AE705